VHAINSDAIRYHYAMSEQQTGTSRLTIWLTIASAIVIFWIRLGLGQILDLDAQTDLRHLALDRQTSIEAVGLPPVFHMESDLPDWTAGPDQVCEDSDEGPGFVWNCFDQTAIEQTHSTGRAIALNYIFLSTIPIGLAWWLAKDRASLAIGLSIAAVLLPPALAALIGAISS